MQKKLKINSHSMIDTLINNSKIHIRHYEITNASKRVRWNIRRQYTYLTQFKSI